MNKIIAALRDGTWFSPVRITRLATAALVATLLFLAFLAVTSRGLNDYSGRPLGTDFSSIYTAGRLAAAGGDPYDPASLQAAQRAVFGDDTPYYGFAYPPVFLLFVWPLTGLAYLPALLLWQGASFLFYLWAMTALKRRFASSLPDGAFYSCAAGYTSVFVCLTHGQSGFLTAGLFAAALALLDVRPWLAGLLFGLVAFKPQFGLLIPFVLAAGDARHVILEGNDVGYAKMVSVFSWFRLSHLPLTLAYGAQLIAALLAVGTSLWVWRSGADARLRGAVLCVGTLLATPFALDYDLMLLAPAIFLLTAYQIEHRIIPFGASLLFCLWAMPLSARSIATAAFVPVANWMLVGCFPMLARQAGTR